MSRTTTARIDEEAKGYAEKMIKKRDFNKCNLGKVVSYCVRMQYHREKNGLKD